MTAKPTAESGHGEAQFAGIIESAMDAIVTVNREQRITLFNAAAERMFRCPAAQAIGQSLDLFIPPRFREVHPKHIAHFGDEGVTSRAMGHLRPLSAVRANGEEFPIEASISQVEVGGQQLFTAIVRDITVRMQSEQALYEAQARFRAIFEAAGIGIALTDSRGPILEVNAVFELMLGHSDAELRGLTYAQITHPHDVKLTMDNLQALASGQTDRCEFEKRYITKEGKRVWARVIYSAVRDSAGKAQYIVKMVEDITGRKRAQARARRAKLEQADIEAKIQGLTAREREVLWMIVAGKPTKVIALELGASPKTIEVHRGRVMEKMAAQSVAQLVQMTMPLRPAGKSPAHESAPSSGGLSRSPRPKH